MRKFLALLLTLAMVVTLLPTGTVYAADVPTGAGVVPDQTLYAPCDVETTLEININEISGDTVTATPSYGSEYANSVIKTYGYTIGELNERLRLVTQVHDEPREGYIRVDVNLENGGSTYFYIHVILTGKYIVNISGVSALDAIYDGTAKAGYTGMPVYKLTSGEAYTGEDIQITYATADGAALDEAPSAVGSYTVTFSVPDTNENYKGSLTLPFRIISESDAEARYQVEAGGTWINTTFTDALASVYAGGTVELLKNVSINGSTVLLNKNMTITSADTENPCVIAAETDGHGYLFRIGADVVLENVIVDGGSESGLTASRALIAIGDGANVSGTLTLSNGAVLQNNSNTTSNGAGGGVCVISGACVIDGGQITGNSADKGGGVAMTNGTDMSLSLISGSIDNNTSTGSYAGYGYGGGVYNNGGSFTMSGGNIKDNKATNTYGDGAGVYVKGSFTMTDGTISGNEASRCGGGLFVVGSGTVAEIKGGIISQNSAKYGGAIYTNLNVTINLSGGSITGNTAVSYAGGILLAPATTVAISGSTVIKSNTSGEETDGGMYYDYDGSGTYDPSSVTIGALGSDAELVWYTWMQSNLANLTDSRLLLASPASGRTSITTSDLGKMTYADTAYDLILDGGKMYLTAAVPATGITLSPDSLSMKDGETATITATLTPENATTKVVWTSSDESVATVAGGEVTACGTGSATITATVGGVSAQCSVTVSAQIDTISVNSTMHKRDYLQNESLDVTNLTILVTYTDGTSETVAVTEDMVSGFDSSVKGLNQKLTVTYEGKQCYFYVHIVSWAVHVYKMGLDGNYPDTYELQRFGVVSDGGSWSMDTAYGTGKYAVEGFTRDEDLSIVSGKIDKDTPYAIFKIYLSRNQYELIFNDEDGTVYSQSTVYYEAPITAPEDPQKEGYEFAGWGEIAETMPAEDVTYTAKWTPLYTVAYDLNGGTGADGVDYSTETVAEGTEITVKAAPTKDGYTFTGWSDGTTTWQPGDKITVDKDITLTAQWTENETPVDPDPDPDPDYPVIIPVGTAKLTKVDAEDNSTVLSGVVFELHKSNGTLVGIYTTDSRGEIRKSGLMPGSYYWKEVSTIDGYILDSTEYPFTVSAWQTTSLVIENSKEEEPENLDDVPDVFTMDHYAYIVGRDDGLVHPEANITRAEVATIFFRLLDEETRNRYMTRENSFSDVSEDAWYNTAVSTMAAMGIVTGRPGGVFDPNANITRAEFAAIAARFDVNGDTTGASFTDIYDHWAQKEINIAANNGWVLGYEDGTFRPDQYITRAEAMTMVNRVLQRIPESADDLLPNMVVWPDNMDTSKWYYLMVQEATNSHYYVRKDNGYESWTDLRENPDWAALEH